MREQTDSLYRVVIFDLDGLLADSEILHCQAYRQTLAEWDVHLSEEGYAEHWIRMAEPSPTSSGSGSCR